jgi:hypothetical protein
LAKLYHGRHLRQLYLARLQGANRVARSGYPPPAPTQRSVQISRTTLFRKRFTAQQWLEVPDRESKALVAVEENLL